MKKSVVICIGIIYIASIVIISLFGMKMSVYNEIVPVSGIEISYVQVGDSTVDVITKKMNPLDTEEKTIYKVLFQQQSDATQPGAMLQIVTHVLPDNASNKNIKYQYPQGKKSFEFYKDGNGKETGLIMFYTQTAFSLVVLSEDGRYKSNEIFIYALSA